VADETTKGGIEARNVSGAITSMRLDELISNLAIGIARGQMELDKACMQIAEFMSRAQVSFGKRPGTNEPDLMSLIELGFTPNFYQFVDTVLEVRVSVSTKFEETTEQDTSQTRLHTNEVANQSDYSNQQHSSSSGYSGGWGWGWWGGGYYGGSSASSSSASQSGSSSFKAKTLDMTTVDAKYASTYNYAVEASSVVKTKIVPVPPPTVFDEIVRAKLQERREAEKRLRLTEEARAILQGQVTASTNMLGAADLLSAVPSTENKDKAAALLATANRLKEDHDSLTNDHWAMGRSVADRATADTRIAAALARIKDLCAFFTAGTGPAEPADLLTAIKSELTGYKAAIGVVLSKLPPPPTQPAPTQP
jgi:hypothetical protein